MMQERDGNLEGSKSDRIGSVTQEEILALAINIDSSSRRKKKCGRKREEGEGQRLMISRNQAETLASAALLPPVWQELQGW